ncbi:hypothetical protein LTR70_006358 [Exophiala xenobiotica]|uniref:Uncharacterized protein n=1 Tax=Lithohypha guttulata TaxID=1690604 RepID=A0ABR0K8B3_9EURO|nr:hypothetical protein LTR24_005827 [Lithohypha guttulata]KAK5316303.1 hypothetical protein LTR70_006358 [Exophiala xenobiotica]
MGAAMMEFVSIRMEEEQAGGSTMVTDSHEARERVWGLGLESVELLDWDFCRVRRGARITFDLQPTKGRSFLLVVGKATESRDGKNNPAS